MANIAGKTEEKKRYVATMNFYVYAESDKAAMQQAVKEAQAFNKREDNRASIDGLVEQRPFTLGNRIIL